MSPYEVENALRLLQSIENDLREFGLILSLAKKTAEKNLEELKCLQKSNSRVC